MADFDVDLFVIGGGSGGVRAARVAAQGGATVALAEESRMGGTCVIRGCVPKKLMVFASAAPAALQEARAYGWEVSEGSFDWPAFRTRLDTELDRLEGIYRSGLQNAGVTIHDQRAVLIDPHTIELADGTRVTARHILVATGGRPFRPEMAGAEHAMVSDDLFHMEALPKSMLIIGGGFIACEFAGILAGLGVEVTQYYRGEQILRGFDGEARGLVADGMRHRGVNLHCGTTLLEAEEREGGIWVKGTNGDEAVYERVLFATGRVPNTAGIGLEEAGVRLGRHGEILVNEYSQTDVPSIYAIGDVTGRINLTPVAIREGMAFVETVFNANPTPVDHELVPSAVYTQPELGTVGLTEEEATTRGPVEVYATSFRPMRSAFAGSPERVMMKLIVDAETRIVLGCHIVAPEAGEMIQLAAIAVKMGATKEQFDQTCAVHPTMAEELVTMRVPARRVG
ncbi:glutathione-disulfide reductase [Pseudoroseicyclus tamaricis]|uniref:Glutathione reductase n=1 Tax=Pseudoroseicyclus tamaricis TaxID=2705421 RepID=A0A6B2JU67_9RHOB|nr:glutathione-disulfide reductase [Pseudoroseicyclus tamaricis]NDV00149.1 glutathione-disulfide reductase [Pseudoroseicyclus tamaricis]